MKNTLLAIALLFFPIAAYADGIPSGKYKHLDGEKFEHVFKETGDYSGKNGDKTYSGVYHSQPKLCWITHENGSKGQTGNVLLYIGKHQCCLNFQKISDKMAVTFIWAKPDYSSVKYGICSGGVFSAPETQ